jgi:predicted Zn-dependent peptidase
VSEPNIRKEVLENGLTILTEKIDHLRSISLGVWLKKGSRHETGGDAGIFHFIEHMLFKGTKKRNAYEVAKIIDSIGGYTDAFTSKENTCFYAKILDEHLPIILELFSDILIHPKFDQEDIERERKVILEEIKMVEDTPSDLVHELLLENFWPEHVLGKPILGTTDTVNAATREQISDRFKSNYIPSNMVVSAAGNIDHDRLVEAIRERFLLEGSNGSRPAPGPEVKPHSALVVRSKKDLEQAHVCIGMMAHDCHHPDRYAAGIMNVILGGSMSSRLFQRIREERGLCYTVYSSINSFQDTGYVNIYAGTGKETLKTAIELILEECRIIARNPVEKEELENAKNHLKGSLMLGLESSSSRMFNLAKNDIYYKRQISSEEILEKISEVTLDDIQRVAKDLFMNVPCGIVVIGDLDENEKSEIYNLKSAI